MSESVRLWLQAKRRWLLGGALLWFVLVAGSAAYAIPRGLAALPIAATWAEWIVAIVAIPYFLGLSTAGRREGRPQTLLRGLMTMAVTTFLLDLIARGVFGLGFKPFL